MIGIVDYDAGNVTCVCNALDRIGASYILTDDPKKLSQTEKILFPGVGHAGKSIEVLQKKGLDTFLKNTPQMILGICVGMQLLFEYNEEANKNTLSIIEGEVKKFIPTADCKVPHMGWNTTLFPDHPLFEGLNETEDMYFVHSYYAIPKDPQNILCSTIYPNQQFCSGVQKGNVVGLQFHPEKSGKKGEIILKNFCNINSFI